MDWPIAALALICAVAAFFGKAFFSKDCLVHPPFVS
jgi:hypothetical protein